MGKCPWRELGERDLCAIRSLKYFRTQKKKRSPYSFDAFCVHGRRISSLLRKHAGPCQKSPTALTVSLPVENYPFIERESSCLSVLPQVVGPLHMGDALYRDISRGYNHSPQRTQGCRHQGKERTVWLELRSKTYCPKPWQSLNAGVWLTLG